MRGKAKNSAFFGQGGNSNDSGGEIFIAAPKRNPNIDY